MLILAAAILCIMSVFHSFVGEKLILQPLNRSDSLPKIWGSQQATFRTIQATWHLVSALWVGLAIHLIVLTFFPAYGTQGFLIVFGTIFALLAVIPLIWKSGKHKSWIAFGLIAVLLLARAFGLGEPV